MMDGIINGLIQTKAPMLVELLIEKVGFSKEQATRFAPVVVKFAVPWIQAKLMGEAPKAELDVAAIAEEAQVSPDLASRGVEATKPALEDMVKDAMGGEALDGVKGLMKGLGGLF